MPRLRIIYLILFFCSGAIGLVYEVLEIRLMHLAIGVSFFSVYTVLCSFMTGMALGGVAANRFLDRVRRPLVAYALLELGAGIAAIPFFFVGRWGSLLGALFTPPFLLGSAYLTPWRASIAFLFLVIPFALLGATLPALSRQFLRDERKGGEIGLFYTVNTFGAAAGCLLTGYELIDVFGVFGTLWIAIAGSTLIAIAGYLLGRKEPEKPPAPAAAASAGTDRKLLILFGCSGLIALSAETIWFRILRFTLRTDTYAFTIMLCVFLAALAAGSLATTLFADRIRKPAKGLSFLMALTALVLPLSLWLFRYFVLQHDTGAAAEPLQSAGASALKAAALMLLPVAGFGGVLPLISRLGVDVSRPAGSIGALLAANTFGAAAGTLLAGLVLIPIAGTAGSIVLLSCLSMALAALIAPTGTQRVILLAASLMLLPLLNLTRTGGALSLMPVFFSHSQQAEKSSQPIWFKEGSDVTAAVLRESLGIASPSFLTLNVNGVAHSATTFHSRRHMESLAYIPAVLHPAPRKVLVICLGAGITAGAAARIPDVEQLDVVELSHTVISTLPFFDDVTGLKARSAATHLIQDDGRNFLQSGNSLYDIIATEPPPPHEAGVVSLYTQEYYSILKHRLAPGGIAVQWVPLVGLSLTETKALAATFQDAFQYVTFWVPVTTHLILVGSDQPFAYSRETASKLFSAARNDLREVGYRTGTDMLATCVAGTEAARRLTQGAQRVTDNAPLVEYFRKFGPPPASPEFIHWMGGLTGQDAIQVPGEMAGALQQQAEIEEMVRRAEWAGFVPLLDLVSALDPGNINVQQDLAIAPAQLDFAEAQRKQYESDPEAWDFQSELLVRATQYEKAAELLNAAIARFPQDARFRVRFSDLYRKLNRFPEAAGLLSALSGPGVDQRKHLLDLLQSEKADQLIEAAGQLKELGEWGEAAEVYIRLGKIDLKAAREGVLGMQSIYLK